MNPEEVVRKCEKRKRELEEVFSSLSQEEVECKERLESCRRRIDTSQAELRRVDSELELAQKDLSQHTAFQFQVMEEVIVSVPIPDIRPF